MKRFLVCGLAALLLSGLSDVAQEKKDGAPKKADAPPAPGGAVATSAKPAPNAAKEVAVIKTTMGEMVLEFWPDVAPKTVENFKSLAKKGFYDGTAFHRIIDGFMIQGGDPFTKDASKSDRWGQGDPGYKIDAEFNDRKHERGVISMARGGDPNSAGCQFFICLAPAPSLDHQYTAFGKLIKGEDVLGKLGSTAVGPGNRGEMSRPVTRAGIESIKIVSRDSIK
jgi:peptidyl-prolyl cis-trans isomerase B (cyclophilin B)